MTNCLRKAFLRLSSDTGTYSAEIKIGTISQGGMKAQNEGLCDTEALYQPSSKENQISRDFAEKRLGYKIDGTFPTKQIIIVWYYHKMYNCKYKSKFRVSSRRNPDVVFGPNDTFVYNDSIIINADDVQANPFGDALKDGHLKQRPSSWRKILLKPSGTNPKSRQSRAGFDSTFQQGLDDNVAAPPQDKSLPQHPIQSEAGFPDLENHTSHLIQEISPTSSQLAKVSLKDPQSMISNVKKAVATTEADFPNGLTLSTAPQFEPNSTNEESMGEVSQRLLERAFAPLTDILAANNLVTEAAGGFTMRSRSLADSSSGAQAELHNQSLTQAFRSIPGTCVSSEPIFGLNTCNGYHSPESDVENTQFDISSAASIPMLRFLQERTNPARDECPGESSWPMTEMDIDETKLMKLLDSNQKISDDPRDTLCTLRERALEQPDQYWHWDERAQKYYHFDDDSEFPIWYELLD